MVAFESDDVNASNDSALMNKPKRPSWSGTVFRAWNFQVTVNADLSQGASTQDKARLLTEHLSNRTAHSMHSIKTSFISVSTFCYESQLSGQPESNGLVSILIRGYVQTKQATPISTMQNFFADADFHDAEIFREKYTFDPCYQGVQLLSREHQPNCNRLGTCRLRSQNRGLPFHLLP
jgi:hypothetical protein